MGPNAKAEFGGNSEPSDDGLAIPDVGMWAHRKYHFLGRYLEAFTTAMRKKWGELHYIDLFAGAGVARIRGSNELVWSSPMLSARVTHPFTQLHLCDASPKNCDALRTRLASARNPRSAQVISGDANQRVVEILKDIPRKDALCMTFADPYGLHLDFETVKRISELRTDIVILMADNMDALRNWATYYFDDPNSNLDRFMGERGWRDLLAQPGGDAASRLRIRYTERLRSLGFTDFAEESVQNSQDRAIYTLIYATKNSAGIKIWRGTSAIDEQGQRRLF